MKTKCHPRSALLLAVCLAVLLNATPSKGEGGPNAAPLIVPLDASTLTVHPIAGDESSAWSLDAHRRTAAVLDMRALVILPPEGSLLVAFKDGDSELQLSPTASPVRILAGTAPTLLTSPGGRFVLQRTTVTVRAEATSTALFIETIEENGSVTIVSESHSTSLPLGRWRIAGGAPTPASPSTAAALDSAAESLRLAPSPSHPLRPFPVEELSDQQAKKTAGATGAAEIEIEAIEVEAGCVEICVD